MIMGLAGHSLDWGTVLPSRLAGRYRTILFDNRGAGRSDQAAGPLTIKQMADDAAGLMDALGIRIERLLLGATAAGGPSRVYPPPEIEKYFTPRTDLSAHDYLLWTAEACYPREFLDAHPDIVEEKISANLAYPGTLQAYLSQLEAFRSFDVEERLSSIRAETMVMTGTKDVLIPPQNSFAIARGIAGAQLRQIKGAGHIFWISHPLETTAIIEGFLG